MSVINLENKGRCSGCTACAGICAHDAITMWPDSLGFLYPVIDESKCVDCGLCRKVCAFNDDYDRSLNMPVPEAYAVRHKETGEIMKSQSGAAFVAISDYILENGGVVYGAGYKDHFRVAHKRATTKEERDEFRGSKYVQSDLTGIFRSVKSDLEKGLTVLFSGTPCQTAGLSAYISDNLRERLWLVDLVCHGVIGPRVWRDYLRYIERRYKKRLINVNFRDKRFGWHSCRSSFRFNDGQTVSPRFHIYRNSLLRPSCGACPFSSLRHPSDITIGDFWGIEKVDSQMGKDNAGVSLLLCNTRKGMELFTEVEHDIYFRDVKTENCLQPNLTSPTVIPNYHTFIELSFRAGGIITVMIILKTLEKSKRICTKCRKLARMIRF